MFFKIKFTSGGQHYLTGLPGMLLARLNGRGDTSDVSL